MPVAAEYPSLKVQAVDAPDAHHNLARMTSGALRRMGLRAGSTIAVHGDRVSYARVLPGRSGALTETDIALPELVISNCGAGIGQSIRIEPVELPILDSVNIEVEDGRPFRHNESKSGLLDQPIRIGDRALLVLPTKEVRSIRIRDCAPVEAGLIGHQTDVEILETKQPRAYPTVGGLSAQIARVREMVELPIRQPELFAHLGIVPPRGILFTGPPGSGKTLLARAVAEQTDAHFYHINAPEIVSKHYGDSEKKLRDVFQEAERNAPSVIFIDEIDAIAPKRDSVSGEKQLEKRVVAQLLTLMDGLSDRGQVVLMAATNLPHMLDPALRRPGRFDREVPFTAPDREARQEILSVHTAMMPLADGLDLASVAAKTDGFVGADLAAVAREAAMATLRRSGALERSVDVTRLQVTPNDFTAALAATGPSALRETQVQTPETAWADVGGLDDTKQMLTEAILWPLNQPQLAQQLGLSPVSGVLLHGPPGSGKTLLARALASESGLNFIPVRGARILSQYLGEAERMIAELFARARHAAPCLMFFDEIDSLAPSRVAGDTNIARVVAQLLIEIDGIEGRGGTILLGATNRIEAIDPALLRPGRFDLTVEIVHPDATARTKILDVHCRGKPLADDVDLSALADASEGWSGAELAALCQGAARQALRRTLLAEVDATTPNITCADFDRAFAERVESDAIRKGPNQCL
ncbi:MAG: AAA family ATPase [Paracoccaceae bacterium]